MGPFTSRRAFLRGAALAVPAAMVAATPVLAAGPSENEALLALGRDLTRAEAVFADAEAKRAAARAVFDSMEPSIPDDLVLSNRDPSPFNWCGETETDVEGNTVYRDDVPSRGPGFPAGYLYILKARILKIDAEDYSARTRIGREVRRRLAIAEGYEAAVQQAKDASGIEAAAAAGLQAGDDLEDVARSIGKARATSAVGILIKARAMVALANVGKTHRDIGGILLGPGLAEDIVRIEATA